MKSMAGLAIALIMASSCTVQSDNPPYDPSEIEAAARQFQELAHTFNYEGLREATTPDFEFLIFGQRMTLDEFETMLRSMETELDGQPMSTYEIFDFHTRIVGDVAYSSWLSDDWLESSVFVRGEDRWLMDQAFAIPIEAAGE
jgi:hypothetical protein